MAETTETVLTYIELMISCTDISVVTDTMDLVT